MTDPPPDAVARVLAEAEALDAEVRIHRLAAALREARERGEAALEEGEKQRRALIDHADALAEERTRDLIADLAALRTRLARFEALAKEAAANVADYIPLANSGDSVKIVRHGREARDILDRLAALHQEDRTDG